MTTLTNENIALNLDVQCKEHPEWGTWTVKQKYAGGVWVIDGRSGNKVLVESELHFWEVVQEPCHFCGCKEPCLEGDDVHLGYEGYPCCPQCNGV